MVQLVRFLSLKLLLNPNKIIFHGIKNEQDLAKKVSDDNKLGNEMFRGSGIMLTNNDT